MRQNRSTANVRMPILQNIAIAATLLGVLIGVGAARAEVTVVTHHYDTMRTGWNHFEVRLTGANVAGGRFGLQREVSLDQEVQAQPLVFDGIVYVATEHDTVYAINGNTGRIVAHRNLGTPVPGRAVPIGITSTPVIDPVTRTMYVMAYVEDNGAHVYRLHALDLTTLNDVIPPVAVSGQHRLQDGTTYKFDPVIERQRSALLLANGNIYAAFGSFDDQQADITRGWVMAWKAATLATVNTSYLTNALITAPDDMFLGSIWMSGAGPATGGTPGDVFVVTANSDKSGATWNKRFNLSESVVKADGTLTSVVDYFTPENFKSLEEHDGDFGAGGIMLLPKLDASPAHVAVAAGKDGRMYLLDQDNLGGYHPQRNRVLGTYPIGLCWCTEAYFVGSDDVPRVVASGGTHVTTWKVRASPRVSLVPENESAQLSTGDDPGFFTSVSSNEKKAGTAIVWAVSRPVSASDLTMRLYAFDAMTLATLYSAPAGGWMRVGGSPDTIPVVANGKVYVATDRRLAIFGLSTSAGKSPASFVAATPESAPESLSAGHDIFGTVTAVEATKFRLQTRFGSILVEPQISTPIAVVGHAVEVFGDYNAAGVFEAESIVHAPTAPQSWAADR
jgi:outer membrane protein assembly factor BamB